MPTPVADAYVEPGAEGPGALPLVPLDLMLCPDCGLCQLVDIVDENHLYRGFRYFTANSPGLVEHFRQYSQRVRERVQLAEGSFVLDIGSNDGTLLSFFKELGHSVLGVDPAVDVARHATTERGVETWADYFNPEVANRILEKKGRAHLITTNNTIANIDPIHDFLNGVEALLHDEGTFVLETGYLSKLLSNRVFDNIYHEHISYFSLAALVKLFEPHGLRIVDVEEIPTKGGSIRVYVAKAAADRDPSGEVERLLNAEREQGLSTVEPFRRLEEHLKEVKGAIHRQLDQVKATPENTAGFGASHSVTTLLHHFELGERLGFLVDDNELKHGRLSPGYGLDVRPASALLDAPRPGRCLILPWRFEEMIVARNEAYMRDGGKFWRVFPDVKEL